MPDRIHAVRRTTRRCGVAEGVSRAARLSARLGQATLVILFGCARTPIDSVANLHGGDGASSPSDANVQDTPSDANVQDSPSDARVQDTPTEASVQGTPNADDSSAEASDVCDDNTGGVDAACLTNGGVDGRAVTLPTQSTIATSTGYAGVFLGLAIDAQDLYMLFGANSVDDGPALPTQVVLRQSRAGGMPTVLTTTPGSFVGGLAVAQGRLYWGGTSGIMSVPVAGGLATTLVPTTLTSAIAPIGTGSPLIAVHGDWLYWLNGDGALFTVATTGGAPQLLASGYGPAGGLAVDDTTVYFGAASDPGGLPATAAAGRILSVPIAGGPVTTLASAQLNVSTVAVAGATLYWTNAGTSGRDTPNADGSVWQMPTTGGAATLLAYGERRPQWLQLVGCTLYWLDSTGVEGSQRTIRKLPAGAANPVDLIGALPLSVSGSPLLAVDACQAYWAQSYGAEISSTGS